MVKLFIVIASKCPHLADRVFLDSEQFYSYLSLSIKRIGLSSLLWSVCTNDLCSSWDSSVYEVDAFFIIIF